MLDILCCLSTAFEKRTAEAVGERKKENENENWNGNENGNGESRVAYEEGALEGREK